MASGHPQHALSHPHCNASVPSVLDSRRGRGVDPPNHARMAANFARPRAIRTRLARVFAKRARGARSCVGRSLGDGGMEARMVDSRKCHLGSSPYLFPRFIELTAHTLHRTSSPALCSHRCSPPSSSLSSPPWAPYARPSSRHLLLLSSPTSSPAPWTSSATPSEISQHRSTRRGQTSLHPP